MDVNTLHDIAAALAGLPDRRIHAAVFARHRDKHVAEGDHRSAALWQALSVALAELDDAERAILTSLDPERHGGSAVIVDLEDHDDSC